MPLVVLDSPYRSVLEPLINYINDLEAREPEAYVTIVLPEFVPARWWQHLLHNQRALILKGTLLFRPEHRRHERSVPPHALTALDAQD